MSKRSKSKQNKIQKKNQNKKKVPVFRIKPEGNNNGTVKYIGLLNENEKLMDEIVELDKPIHPCWELIGKNALPLDKFGQFNMLGRIHRCNIVGTHIVVSRRYPAMYIDVSYERPMVSGSLFQIFISIDMTMEDKKAITENKKYVNLRFKGNWYMHIDCDEELTANYDNMIENMLQDDAADIFYKSDDIMFIEKRKTYTDSDVLDWIAEYVKKEKPYYDMFIKEHEIEFKSLIKLRDMFIDLSQSTRFNKFISIAMKCRELYRRKENGIDDTNIYSVDNRDNVVKMIDIENALIENDELIFD